MRQVFVKRLAPEGRFSQVPWVVGCRYCHEIRWFAAWRNAILYADVHREKCVPASELKMSIKREDWFR